MCHCLKRRWLKKGSFLRRTTFHSQTSSQQAASLFTVCSTGPERTNSKSSPLSALTDSIAHSVMKIAFSKALMSRRDILRDGNLFTWQRSESQPFQDFSILSTIALQEPVTWTSLMTILCARNTPSHNYFEIRSAYTLPINLNHVSVCRGDGHEYFKPP